MGIFKKGTLTPIAKPDIGKLAIIIGHQKSAQGAQGVSPLSMSEYAFNTKYIAPLMVKECDKQGITSKIFLRDGSDIERVGASVSAWADKRTCAIELHFNSFNGIACGTETLYDSSPAGNTKFAQMIQNRVAQCFNRVGKTDRGIKLTNAGRGSHNLTSVLCTGALCEPFFGDVASEALLAWERKEAYAAALVSAAFDYLSSL